MSSARFSWKKFSAVPIVGIVRNNSFEDLIKILPIYVNSGLNTIEITMDTAKAEEMIRYARNNYDYELNVGAGTVCEVSELRRAIDAGAQFIVTPILNKKVIKICVKENIPVFSGAFSPTEIYKAWSLGASVVKVYPATSLGAQYIKDIKTPLPQIKLMPTGGINLINFAGFMETGAASYGVGSQLFDKKHIENKNWDELGKHFAAFVEKIKKK
jgi:2-dehydro-3-deoxyphosphogluconate aldolase/(4S)-4-hydroxy-2-oxoglutarate aldolase